MHLAGRTGILGFKYRRRAGKLFGRTDSMKLQGGKKMVAIQEYVGKLRSQSLIAIVGNLPNY
jgi:hypothetical protein